MPYKVLSMQCKLYQKQHMFYNNEPNILHRYSRLTYSSHNMKLYSFEMSLNNNHREIHIFSKYYLSFLNNNLMILKFYLKQLNIHLCIDSRYLCRLCIQLHLLQYMFDSPLYLVHDKVVVKNFFFFNFN